MTRPTIRDIAITALRDMRSSGESHEMCARWISERIRHFYPEVEPQAILIPIEPQTGVGAIKPRDPTWIQRMYSLTNEFHTKTQLKVRIQDLLEAFFCTSMSGIEPDDQDTFEFRLRERLEEQSPGWDK